MRYDPRTHHRRSIRLAGFDYSRAGAYFVTICAHNRELFLQAESVRDAVRTAWYELPERFPGGVLDEFVIMPNHIHGIIILEGRTASSVPTVLGAASGAQYYATRRREARPCAGSGCSSLQIAFWHRGQQGLGSLEPAVLAAQLPRAPHQRRRGVERHPAVHTDQSRKLAGRSG